MDRTNFKRIIIIFIAIHIFIFLILFALLPQVLSDEGTGAGSLELWFAERMLDGNLPYHDFASEYPPLALLSFLLPGLFFQTPGPYSWAFAIELMIFDLLVLLMLADLSQMLKNSLKNTLMIYTLAIAAVGPILVARYDLLPAMLVMAAIWSFVKGKNKLAWAAAALGFAAKLYPIIIIPFFLIYQVKNRQYGRLIKGGATFLITLIVLFLPWIIINAGGFWQSFTYHFERPLHSESTYGTVLLTGQVLGLTQVRGDLTFGSWNLFSPLADSLAETSFPLTAAFLLIIYGMFIWRLRKEPEENAIAGMSVPITAGLLKYTALTVTVFLLTNKVFSAQYMAWLCPLIPLAAGGRQLFIPTIFIVTGTMTQYVYPYNYIDFELGKAVPVLILLFRNILLILMAIQIALVDLRRNGLYQTQGNRALRSRG